MSFEEVLGSLEIGPNKNEGSEEEDQIAGLTLPAQNVSLSKLF